MSFLNELKRRNVIRVGILYAVASWFLLQVADVLFGIIGVPDWSLRLVFVILALGFPIAIVLSWIYDITPEGLRRESEIEPAAQTKDGQRSQRLNIVTAIVVILGIAFVIVDRLLPENGESAVPASDISPASSEPGVKYSLPKSDRPSIAVLPFENFSGSAEDEYFSEGLADTVLHQLAQIPNLKVIARNSSFQFKGTNVDVREVGQRLGVANVLEGSVQRYGEQIRVIAQLVRTSDGTHVWSQSFDYEMGDVFALHDAIARAVTEQMQVSLLPGQDVQIDLGGTKDPMAYDLLLQSQAMFDGSFTPAVADRVDPDVDYPPMERLDEALMLDPDYVDAIISKARIYNLFAFQTTSIQRKSEFVDRARPLVQRALELAPDYSAAWAVKGSIAHRSGNETEAIIAFRKAIELNPNDADAHQGLAVASIQSAPLDTIEHMRIAHQLDPENPFNRPTVMALARLNRIDAAIAELNNSLTGNSGLDQMIMDDLADVHHSALGRHDESAQWAGKLLALQPGSPRGIVGMALAWMAVGDTDRAARWLATADAEPGAFDFLNTAKLRLRIVQGDLPGAQEILDSARPPSGPLAAVLLSLRARLCLLMQDLDCARQSVMKFGEVLQQAAARGLELDEWRASQQLIAAAVAGNLGESPGESAQAVINTTRGMTRAGWVNDSARYMDAEAFVLLNKPELALGPLEETLLKDGGFLPFDSFLLPADQGLVLSKLDGASRFEDWRRRFRERREAMREKMVEMEQFQDIPAPPDAER